jgi:hypothetical protein
VNSDLSEKLRKAASSVELAVRYNSALGRLAELFGINPRVVLLFICGFSRANWRNPVLKISLVGLGQLEK